MLLIDARLRSLTRDAAQGDPEAPARLLLERARAGELSAERLRLAAWLGDARALAVVGPGAVRPQPDELLAWLLDLNEVGPKEAVIRALVSVGSSAFGKAHEESPEIAAAAWGPCRLTRRLELATDDPRPTTGRGRYRKRFRSSTASASVPV